MIFALIATIIIEALVMWLLTKSGKWCKYNFYCNLVTNPLLNIFIFLFARFYVFIKTGSIVLIRAGGDSFWEYYLPLFIGEIAVLFSEMKLYELMTGEERKTCFKYSLITNLVSATFGIILKILL